MFVFTNFNTPDQAGLPGFETASSTGSTDGFDVVSNSAQTDVTSGTAGAAFYSTAPGSDQWAQVTLATNSGTSVGPTVRSTRLNTTTLASTGYYVRHNGTSLILLRLNADGSTTQLGSSYSATRAVGDVIRLQVVGSNLSVFLNSVTNPVITATDSTFTTGTIGFRAGAGSGIRVEDFTGGDVMAYNYTSVVNSQIPGSYYTLEATNNIETMGTWAAKAALFGNGLWGSGDCRITDYTQPSGTFEYAWSGWLNLSAVAAGANTQFVDSQVSGTGMFSLIMDNIDTYTGRMFVRNSNNVDYDITRNYKFDTWVHLAVTTNASGGDTGDVYLNGVKVISNMSMGNFTKGTANRRIRWGGNLAGGTWKYDEMAVWRRSLTSSEVLAQYNAGPFPAAATGDMKQTATAAAMSFVGTDANNVYQPMDTTKVSGYRAMLLGQRTTSYYTDGLALTNLGAAGGSWETVGNAGVQQQGKFTGGIKLVGQAQDISSIGITGHANTPTGISFWYRAIGVTTSRVIYAEISGSTNLRYLQVNPNGTVTLNGENFTNVTNAADEKWHHVVLASSAGNTSGAYTLYFDGVGKGPLSAAFGSKGTGFRFQTPANTTTFFDEMSVIANGAAPYTSANVTQQYNYKEYIDKATAGTFGLFGTTNNTIRGVRGVYTPATAATIGMNGTNNNTARVNKRDVAGFASATFAGVNAVISSTRNYRFPVPAGTASLTGTNGNRGYTPAAAQKAEPAYAYLRGVDARVYAPKPASIVAPIASMSFTGTNGHVAKTRTDRTVVATRATTLVRGMDAKLKINGTYVDNFDNNNRWYKQIRATHIAKFPGSAGYTPAAEDGWAWFKFEGDTPPYLAPGAANGRSTGPVQVVGNFELGIDAGHNRHGIKFSNGGYFQTRITYPFLIPGAQLPLLGGLRTHYTAEFAFRTITPGPICSGVRINAAGKLEFQYAQDYWYELRTEYPNLLDGQWHHMVFISPQQYFVPPESNPDRNFVLVDGKVVSAVHAPYYVPNTWGYDARDWAYGENTRPGVANPSIEFDDIIISPFRIISVAEASKLYYEYSDAIIVNAGNPARGELKGTAENRAKGNVFRVLAFYGSPPYTSPVSLEQLNKYTNDYSEFTIRSEAQQGQHGFFGDGGRGATFRHNGMLVFPVSYVGGHATASGLLDPGRASYIDDLTGYTRLIDLENDFAVDPADFDMITFVRWPQMNDGLVTRRYPDRFSYDNPANPGVEANDIRLARQNNIEKFSKQILKLAAKGVHIWVQDPETAQGLGIIQSYVSNQDQMTERNEEMSVTGAEGVKNLGARNTEKKYGKRVAEGTFGSPGYFDVGHNIWKRRITAKIEGLTDIPGWNEVDKVYWYDSNPFKSHAEISRRKYKFYEKGYEIGDEFGLDFNTAYFGRYPSADPNGVIGTVVAREQALVSTKAGTFVENPYKNRVTTIAVESGTEIKGIKITGRIFAEMTGGFTQPYQVPGNDKYYYNGVPLGKKDSDWDYDSERENQIVAYYAVEKFRNDLYLGSETHPYIVYGDSVPTNTYIINDMHSRGINWMKSYQKPAPGSTKVTATAAVVNLRANDANAKPVRNTKITAPVARARFEIKIPANYKETNTRVTSFPGTVTFRGVDIQAIIKAEAGIMTINGVSSKAAGVGEDIALYYSNWNPVLYKEDI